MSFKREGDDQALLHNLKMRRVSELLGEHIPDDEAMLLSNGRLTCLICNHRPIFDTFVILSNHRKGKKHIEELGKHLLHKRELEYKKLKSHHHHYLQTEAIKRSNVKFRNKSFSRKMILNVLPQPDMPGNELSTKPSASSVVRHYLKGIQRKRALQKTVEKCRENYNHMQPSSSTAESHPEVSHHSTKISQEKSYIANTSSISQDIQLRMSGWIKSSDGKWIKDPDVEFDSDEEPPDSQQQTI